MPSPSLPREIDGLPAARSTAAIELSHGDRFEIRVAPVAKRLGDQTVRMLSYNGMIPGPTLRVRQGSELTVGVVNGGDLDTTVHWHGLRLDNAYDGTAATQRPIPVGGQFTYQLTFPDPGAYWYHPHIREDYGQELGLYGTIIVEPQEPDYWPMVHREIALTLDDILLEDGKVAPFEREGSTHTAMGRFGNVMLTNGEVDPVLEARENEVIRFYLTNTANTRVFNVGLPGARMKLVGGDSGRCEREEIVERILIAPSERVVIDVLFGAAGKVMLVHHTPRRQYQLATIAVGTEQAQPPRATEFHALRTNSDLVAEREHAAAFLQAAPDKTVALVAEMNLGEVEGSGPATAYACPMHPDVRSNRPDACPKCGMKLVPAHLVGGADHGQHDHHHDHTTEPQSGSAENENYPAGIEWEDDMVEVNRITTPSNTRWTLVDRDTGASGSAIDWRFRVGDRVKIRLLNEMHSDHPMHHPFHIHGAGRFLILSRDGVVEPNLVWKDTVLIPTGQTVDLLLLVTNPGIWMAHCHIAEHHEGGMMFSFRVDP